MNEDAKDEGERWAGIAVGVAGIFLVIGAFLGFGSGVRYAESLPLPPGQCYEDQAIFWDGEAHTKCVNIDELLQDYMEANDD